MPRNSSTNLRTLSTRIAALEQTANPSVTFSMLRGHPPPVSNNFKQVRRSVLIRLTDTANLKLTTGAISTALGAVTGDFRIERLDLYSSVLDTQSGGTIGHYPSCTFTLLTRNVMINNTTLGVTQDIIVTDYGTASSAPGVSFKIPKTRAPWITRDTAGTAEIANATTSFVAVVHLTQQILA